MGRQKIPMEKIKNEAALQVSFSKRRFGVFKKANELATLCGALVALIVFSPSGRLYSIGFPSVDTVLDLFLNDNLPSDLLMQGVSPMSDELNTELMEVSSLYEQQHSQKIPIENELKKASENIDLHHSTSGLTFDGNSLQRLELLQRQLMEVKQRLNHRKYQLDLADAAATPTDPQVSPNEPAPIPAIHSYLGFHQLRLNKKFNPYPFTPVHTHRSQTPSVHHQQNQQRIKKTNTNYQKQKQKQKQIQQPNLNDKQQIQQTTLNYQQPIMQPNLNYQQQQQLIMQPNLNNHQHQQQQQLIMQHNLNYQQQPIMQPNLNYRQQQQPIKQANLIYQQQLEYQKYQQYQNPRGEFANMDSLEFAINTNFYGKSSNEAGPSKVNNVDDNTVNHTAGPPSAFADLRPPLAVSFTTGDVAHDYMTEILLNDDEDAMTQPIDAEVLRRYEESLMARPDSPNDLETYFTDLDRDSKHVGIQIPRDKSNNDDDHQ